MEPGGCSALSVMLGPLWDAQPSQGCSALFDMLNHPKDAPIAPLRHFGGDATFTG